MDHTNRNNLVVRVAAKGGLTFSIFDGGPEYVAQIEADIKNGVQHINNNFELYMNQGTSESLPNSREKLKEILKMLKKYL